MSTCENVLLHEKNGGGYGARARAISYLMGDTNVSLGLLCGALFLALAGIISACAESHT